MGKEKAAYEAKMMEKLRSRRERSGVTKEQSSLDLNTADKTNDGDNETEVSEKPKKDKKKKKKKVYLGFKYFHALIPWKDQNAN